MENPGAHQQHETPRARQQQASKGPSHNIGQNSQRANAILYTPRRHGKQRAMQESPLSSPTPLGRSTRPSAFATAAESGSGSDEPEVYIRRLSLGTVSASSCYTGSSGHAISACLPFSSDSRPSPWQTWSQITTSPKGQETS
jgi:hypothetical protein